MCCAWSTGITRTCGLGVPTILSQCVQEIISHLKYTFELTLAPLSLDVVYVRSIHRLYKFHIHSLYRMILSHENNSQLLFVSSQMTLLTLFLGTESI